jgi:hypothetical protein
MSSTSKINVFGAKTSPRFIKLDLSPPLGSSVPAEQYQLLKSFMLQSVHLDVSLNEFASHGTLTFVLKNPRTAPNAKPQTPNAKPQIGLSQTPNPKPQAFNPNPPTPNP